MNAFSPGSPISPKTSPPHRLLVMDDEEIVRLVVGKMLKHLGFEVEFAKEGQEAVTLYRESVGKGRGYEAVIVDLNVPGGLGGVEILPLLRAINPQCKVVVSSGYAYDPEPGSEGPSFDAVIRKPFELSQLQSILGEVVGS